MSTIAELIDSGECVLGETKIARSYWLSQDWWVPYYDTASGFTYGLNSGGRSVCWSDDAAWQVYVEPIEMEDRWLWAGDDGYTFSHFHSKSPNSRATIKLEYTKTQFPKEKT